MRNYWAAHGTVLHSVLNGASMMRSHLAELGRYSLDVLETRETPTLSCLGDRLAIMGYRSTSEAYVGSCRRRGTVPPPVTATYMVRGRSDENTQL